MQSNVAFVTFVLTIAIVLFAVVALGARRLLARDGRDASMHTHEVLARRRKLLAIEAEKKKEKKKV